MYVFNQPSISVEEEEAGIKAMIDEKYERMQKESTAYYKQLGKDYYNSLKL